MNRAQAGYLGGMATLERYGPEHYRLITKGRQRIRRNSITRRGWGAVADPFEPNTTGRKEGQTIASRT